MNPSGLPNSKEVLNFGRPAYNAYGEMDMEQDDEYSDNYYTTQLDESKFTEEQKRQAEK